MVRIVMLMMVIGLAHVNGQANSSSDDSSDDSNMTNTTPTTTMMTKTASSSATTGTSSTSGTTSSSSATTGTSSTSGTTASSSATTGTSSTSGTTTGGSSTSGTSTGGTSTGGGSTTKTVFKSELTIAVSDPAAFVNAQGAKNIVRESIAESSPALLKSYVTVTALTVTGGRRLSVISRRLAASVNAKFTVTFPAGHPSPVLTAQSMDKNKLVAAMNTKAKAAGIAVTVTGVTVEPPVAVTGGGTTTTTPQAKSTTLPPKKTTSSPSVRHFLSIGITTIAIMSLMFGR